MRYYLRNPADGAISGPLELDDIEAKLKAGELSADTRATGDIGESLRQVRSTPAEDWMPVRAIPGIGKERQVSMPLGQINPSLPAPTPPPPAELFPAHIWGKHRSPSEQISFCPFCGQRASGPVVPGETECERCGKLLYPAAGTVERTGSKANRPVSLLTFIAGVIGGLIVQFISFVMVCGFAALSFRQDGSQKTIAFAVLLCLGWIALAIPMTRSPANRGFAFGALLGVGLTALLAASCALK